MSIYQKYTEIVLQRLQARFVSQDTFHAEKRKIPVKKTAVLRDDVKELGASLENFNNEIQAYQLQFSQGSQVIKITSIECTAYYLVALLNFDDPHHVIAVNEKEVKTIKAEFIPAEVDTALREMAWHEVFFALHEIHNP